MNVSDPASPRPSAADPAVRDVLMELAGLGLRIARVAAEVAEVEGRVVALVAAGLPDAGGAASLPDAETAGLAVDAADGALREAGPRIAAAGHTFERVSRAVRRTVALVKRIEAGWPRQGGSDDRRSIQTDDRWSIQTDDLRSIEANDLRSMARWQIARDVGARIVRHATGEAAERLFDDLAERLDGMELGGDLDLPVGEVVAAICRAMGLPEPALDEAEAQRMGGDGSLLGFLPDG